MSSAISSRSSSQASASSSPHSSKKEGSLGSRKVTKESSSPPKKASPLKIASIVISIVMIVTGLFIFIGLPILSAGQYLNLSLTIVYSTLPIGLFTTVMGFCLLYKFSSKSKEEIEAEKKDKEEKKLLAKEQKADKDEQSSGSTRSVKSV